MEEDERDYDAARARMVAEQLAGRDIDDPAVLRAMRLVPRERFVPRAARPYAYDDGPLPIPANQTISQPYVCLLYTSPSPRDRTRSRMPSSA